MLNTLVFHPILFVLYPILFLYSENIDEAQPLELPLPILISLAGTGLLYALLIWVFRDKRKAAILASLAVLLVFSYGYILELRAPLKHAFHFNFSKDKAYLLMGLTLLGGLFYTVRAKESLVKATQFLNLVSLILVGSSLFNIAANLAHAHTSIANGSETTRKVKMASVLDGKKPDIYYIILDAYPRADAIQRYLGGNNREFVQALAKRGFYVAPKSCSNYPETFLSLASSLNFKYLDFPPANRQESVRKSGDDSDYMAMLRNYELERYLKEQRYKYIHVGSWSPPFRRNPNADTNYVGPADEFPLALFQTTLLSEFSKDEVYYDSLRKHILHTFGQMDEVPGVKGPKFVFAHIICPHSPIHFDRYGNPTKFSRKKVSLNDDAEGTPNDYKAELHAYREQLIYLNTRVLAMIDRILRESKTPPVIVIQGDHGSNYTGSLRDNWTPDYFRERMSILNAYHLPGNGADNRLNVVYPSITPVSSFRRIFNYYFGTEFPQLPDKQYFIKPKEPYTYYDITEKTDCKA